MAEKPRTPHQVMIVKSSAGAGKTYNLALRYLQLLLLDKTGGYPGKTRISNIVAITFTNKAAREMRSRIIDWMKRIILDLTFEGSLNKPIDEISGSGTGINNDGNNNSENFKNLIKEAIERNFEELIKNFYDFNVGTIDSFVNLTLKASTFKLDLLPDFDISIDSATYIDIVLQECLQKILEDDVVRAKFDWFLKNYIELEGERVKWIPKDFLRDIISGFWGEEAKENADFIYKDNISGIRNIKNKVENEISELSSYLKKTEGMKPEKRFIDALDKFSLSAKTGNKLSNYFLRQSLEASMNKNSLQPDMEHENSWKNILSLLSIYFETISESKFSSYVDIYLLFKKILNREITHNKKLVLIEQLNTLLQQILDREHFVPEIYYALAENFSHFLIDEFQDTNHLQWKNIEILAEEALSRGGTLFLVGDKKQAIYRWRGGKSELVDDVIKKYKTYPVYELKLSKNYRSDESIVKFNNVIFKSSSLKSLIESATEGISPDNLSTILETYSDSWQQFVSTKEGRGYISIEKITADNNGDRENPTDNDVDSFSKLQINEIIKNRFIQLIRDIKNRGIYRDKDIAVLVRRKEEARLIVRALLETGCSVESEFTVNVRNNPRIREMINFLSFINAPDNDLAFAGFLTGTIFQKKTLLSVERINQWIEKIRTERNPDLLYRKFQDEYQHVWDEFFEYFFKRAGYLPLYELVVLFLKKWEALTSFPDDAPFFMHICELIKEREIYEGSNLNKFLQFWNNDSISTFQDRPEGEKPFLLNTFEGTNAVKVMTIHRAKGLQFPLVILPFLKFTSFSSSDAGGKTKYFVKEGKNIQLLYIKKDFTRFSQKLGDIYQQKEAEYLLDELNNIYVSSTRAEKELYIFLSESKKQKNHLIDYLFNLEDLKKYVNSNTIKIGTEVRAENIGDTKDNREDTRQRHKEKKENEHEKTDKDSLLFGNIGNDIKWMKKINTDSEEMTVFFKEQLFAKKKGDTVHYILSLIKRLPDEYGDFLKSCISAGIAKYAFHPYTSEIKDIVAKFFLNPEFKKFFTPDNKALVYTEKEITDITGNAYKVDRIIITGPRIDIVDFKTGEIYSADHSRQIIHYGELLEKIHPGKLIKKYILYIDEGIVREI